MVQLYRGEIIASSLLLRNSQAPPIPAPLHLTYPKTRRQDSLKILTLLGDIITQSRRRWGITNWQLKTLRPCSRWGVYNNFCQTNIPDRKILTLNPSRDSWCTAPVQNIGVTDEAQCFNTSF